MKRRTILWIVGGVAFLALQVGLYPWLYAPPPEVLYQQALNAQLRGDTRASLEPLARLHRRQLYYRDSRFLSGWAHHCERDYEAALRDYKLCVQYNPTHMQTYANAGFILKELGRYEEAVAMFRKVQELAPGNAMSLAVLKELAQKTAAPPAPPAGN